MTRSSIQLPLLERRFRSFLLALSAHDHRSTLRVHLLPTNCCPPPAERVDFQTQILQYGLKARLSMADAHNTDLHVHANRGIFLKACNTLQWQRTTESLITSHVIWVVDEASTVWQPGQAQETLENTKRWETDMAQTW